MACSEKLHCWGNRPLEITGETRRCLNLGSYNYLGFANQDPYCTPQVLEALEKYGWGPCSSRADAGAHFIPAPSHARMRGLCGFCKHLVLQCGSIKQQRHLLEWYEEV